MVKGRRGLNHRLQKALFRLLQAEPHFLPVLMREPELSAAIAAEPICQFSSLPVERHTARISQLPAGPETLIPESHPSLALPYGLTAASESQPASPHRDFSGSHFSRERFCTMDVPIANESRIIVFDDECPLCSRWAWFVIDRDTQGLFKFTGLGSAAASIFVRDSSLLTAQTVILVAHEGTYTKSSAILYILERLSGYGWLSRALRLIPRRIRDTAYDFVARHRKALFRGNRQSCRLPSSAPGRFL